MNDPKSILPRQIRKRIKELQRLSRLANARNMEARSTIKSDDFTSISTADRILAVDLIDLLRRTEKLVEDVTKLVANPRPPALAEYVLHLVLGKEEREAVIGDLVQDYRHIRRRFGKRKADFWFHKQVIWSLWPFLRRAVVKSVALVWVGKLLRRLT